MANTFRVETYRSPRSLGLVVTAIFGLQLLCFAAYVLFGFGALILPEWVVDLDEGGTLSVFVIAIGLISLLEIALLLAGIVVFLVWVHRTYSNLSPLRARDLNHSPGWAVGWWFIPIANLFKPYQVVKEIWVESDPDYDEELGFMPSSFSAPSLLGFWWAAWIISNVVARIADRASEAPDGGVTEAFPYLIILSGAVRGAAAVLAILVVRGVVERQERRWARLASSRSDVPPAPPTFGGAPATFGEPGLRG